MNKTLHEHKYPDYFVNNPELIKLLYASCYLSQFRKWYLQPLLKSLLQQLPKNAVYADLGAGEGQFLFPFADKYSHLSFLAVDKTESNFNFYKLYIQNHPFKNVTALHAAIEDLSPTMKVDIAVCVGVLHFIPEDNLALKRMHEILNSGGRLVLQVPVNGKTVLGLYKYLLKRYGNYDTVQSRKHSYNQAELIEKVQQAGFNIERQLNIYGFFGKLAHELFNIPFTMYLHGNILVKVLAFVCFNLFLPFVFLFYFIDYCIPAKKSGNGIILVCSKK